MAFFIFLAVPGACGAVSGLAALAVLLGLLCWPGLCVLCCAVCWCDVMCCVVMCVVLLVVHVHEGRQQATHKQCCVVFSLSLFIYSLFDRTVLVLSI